MHHMKLTERGSGNGIIYNRDEFCVFMLQFRKDVINRKLISQSFIVAPSDPEGREGTVGRISNTTGIHGGKLTNFHAVAVATMVFEEKSGRRTVIRETSAMEIK